MFGLCVVRARLGQLPGKRVRTLLKMQDQRVKKGVIVEKCVSEFACEHIVNVHLCSSSKDERATSSNPSSGGSTQETTPTNTPSAGESGSNSVSKTAESSSDNAEPMEH